MLLSLASLSLASNYAEDLEGRRELYPWTTMNANSKDVGQTVEDDTEWKPNAPVSAPPDRSTPPPASGAEALALATAFITTIALF